MSALGSKFGHSVYKAPVKDARLVDAYAKVGVEIEVERCGIPVAKTSVLDWQPHRDDSLRNNGMEFTTVGGLVGGQLVTAINNFCDFAEKHKFDEGYPRAGIHLHIDMTDMNENNNNEFLNCVLAYILFEKALFRFAGEWREACGFCDPLTLSQRDLGAISKLLYDWDKPAPADRVLSKYQAINFIPLYTQGTLEFRHLPTTFDRNRILDWINICCSFRKYGKEINIDPVDYLMKHGLDALINVLFTTVSKVIAPYVRAADVWAAVADARYLRILSAPPHSSASFWNEPDNPLLLAKNKRRPKKEAATVPATEPANAAAVRRAQRAVDGAVAQQRMEFDLLGNRLDGRVDPQPERIQWQRRPVVEQRIERFVDDETNF